MVASDELADIVEHTWSIALGGPQTAIEDGIIVPFNENMEKFAPALSRFLADNKDIDKAVKTDDGQYYVFPFIRNDDKLLLSAGPIIRKDWLDDLGLAVPETIADWETMLTRFKEEKNATAPLTLQNSQKTMLLALFSANSYFYNDNGTIKYGPVEPEYLEALKTLNRWFTTGLLDKNYTLVDTAIQDANILNGKSGATFWQRRQRFRKVDGNQGRKRCKIRFDRRTLPGRRRHSGTVHPRVHPLGRFRRGDNHSLQKCPAGYEIFRLFLYGSRTYFKQFWD